MMAAYDRQVVRDLGELLTEIVVFGETKPVLDSVRIHGLALDSRQIEPGMAFLALAGGRGHGMDFVEPALARGAAAILAEPGGAWPEDRLVARAGALAMPLLVVPGLGRQVSELAARWYGRPAASMQLIGVTGTNGKTSVAHFLAQSLAGGFIGTIGHGRPGHLVPSSHTTPDPIRLQAILAERLAAGDKTVAMEVSSHALHQGRAEAVEFDLAVFTNLSRDHLDYHGDMVNYGAAKRSLFDRAGLRWALINADDPTGLSWLREGVAAARVLAFGRQVANLPVDGFVELANVLPTHRGQTIDFHTSWGDRQIDSPLLGDFNASNLAAVLGCQLVLGRDLEVAATALGQIFPVPGRMNAFGGDGQPLVVVDYAHTPDALEQALAALRAHLGDAGSLRLVFGCGGERDRGKRPLMGRVAEQKADQVWLTDDNPRGEDGDLIIAEIRAGMADQTSCQIQRQRALAIRAAILQAKPDDVILVAGKGHEDYQQVGDLRLPFNDAEQVVQALTERGAA